MDLLTLIQNVRDLIAAIRAGDYFAAMLLAIEIIKGIAGSLPAQNVGNLRATAHAGIALDSLTVVELTDKLQEACDAEAGAMHATATATATGPFVDKILPLLIELLKRWLGL